MTLTLEERATNNETFRHIERVRNLLNACVVELLKRGELHDQTKLESPEVEAFTEYTPKLAECTYGSDEYKGFLDAIKPALSHHYAHNRHHPEHPEPEGNSRAINKELTREQPGQCRNTARKQIRDQG